MKIVVDSYAWIEIFLGSEKGKVAFDSIQDSEQVITPDVVLAEIARKYAREGVSENIIRRRMKTMVESSQVSHVDEECAIFACRAYVEMRQRARELKLRKPGLFDAIILGTTRMIGSKVLTGDSHFQGLSETIWLG